jgi:hypothetical protein
VGAGEELRLADRLALRALVESYARGVDRRDLDGVAALFTPDGVLASHRGDPAVVPELSSRHGRAEIVAALQMLHRYEVTSHLLGQQTLWFDDADADHARGETYCLAHHLWERDGERVNRVMSIRYQDRYAREGGEWRFAERRLAIDWQEDRPITNVRLLWS